MKRFLSVILCVLMFLGVASIGVSAGTFYVGYPDAQNTHNVDGVISEGEYSYTSGELDTKKTTEDVMYLAHGLSTAPTSAQGHTAQFYVGYDESYIYLGYTGVGDMKSAVTFYLNPNISTGARDTLYLRVVYNWNSSPVVYGSIESTIARLYTADDTYNEVNWADYVEECAGLDEDNGSLNVNTIELKIKRSALSETAFDQIGVRAFIQPEATGKNGELYWGGNPATSVIPYSDIWCSPNAGYHVFNLYDRHKMDGVISENEYSWTSGQYDRNTNVKDQFVVSVAHSDAASEASGGLWSQYWIDYDEDYIYIAYKERGAYGSTGWIDINPCIGLEDGSTSGQIFINYSYTRNDDITTPTDVATTAWTFIKDAKGNAVTGITSNTTFTFDGATYVKDFNPVVEAKGLWLDDGYRNVNTIEFKIDRSKLEEYANSEFDSIGFRGVVQSNGEAFYCNQSESVKPLAFYSAYAYHKVDLFPAEGDPGIDGIFDSGEYFWESPAYDKKIAIEDEYYVVSEYTDASSLTCKYLVSFDEEYIYIGYTERTYGYDTDASIDLAPILANGAASGQLHLDITANKKGHSVSGTIYNTDGTQSTNISDYLVQSAATWYDDGYRHNNRVEIKLSRAALEACAGASFDTVGILGISENCGGVGILGNTNAPETLRPTCEYEGVGYVLVKIAYNAWVKFNGTHHIMNDGNGTLTYGFHDWNAGEVISDAAEFEDGKIAYTCTVCGAVDKDVIPASGHSLLRVEAKAATCTEAGYTQHKACQLCNYTYKYEAIASSGHTETAIPAVPATCTSVGYTAGVKCSSCGTVLTPQTEIPAAGHTYDNEFDADCNSCGEVREVACVHASTTTTEIDRVESTCSEAGSYVAVVTCNNCSEEISRTPVELPLADHTEETIPGVEATCTKTGLSEGTKCSVCDAVIVAQKTLKKSAHSYATATDVGDGKHRFTCTVCSVTRTDKHNFSIVDGVNKCDECSAVPETIFDLGAVGQKHEYVGDATTDAPVITNDTFDSSKYNEIATVESSDMENASKNDYFFWSNTVNIGHFKIYITYDANKIYLAAEVDVNDYADTDMMRFNISTGKGSKSFELSANGSLDDDVFVSSKVFAPTENSGIAVYAVEIDRVALALINTMDTAQNVDGEIALSVEYTNGSGTATFGTTATNTVPDASGNSNLVNSGDLLGMALSLDSGEAVGETLGGYGESTNINISGEYVNGGSEEVISVILSWNVPTFTYNVKYVWNSDILDYEIDTENTGWTASGADITISNNSNQRISATFSFATNIVDSGIVGKFTDLAVVDTDSDSDVDITDVLATAALADNKVIIASAAPTGDETVGQTVSEIVYFYVTGGVLPETHTPGSSIGNITITIGGFGN